MGSFSLDVRDNNNDYDDFFFFSSPACVCLSSLSPSLSSQLFFAKGELRQIYVEFEHIGDGLLSQEISSIF